jgi:5-methylthioadenosine/S-adenosylhomocysteine deaminase
VVPGTTFIHRNGMEDQEFGAIRENGCGLSIAPAIELMMGHGYPPLVTAAQAGLRISLSVDVEVTASADMFTQMRAAYQAARYSQLSAGASPSATVGQILHYATLSDAETLALGERTGSLRPGKQADLVILRADRPDVAPAPTLTAPWCCRWTDPISTRVLVAGKPVERGHAAQRQR